MASQPPPYSNEKGQMNAGYTEDPTTVPPGTVVYNNPPPLQQMQTMQPMQPMQQQQPIMQQQLPMQQQQSSAVVSNNTIVVGQPAAPVIIHEPAPPSYMVMSVLTCLCCNCIFGIVAIILSFCSQSSAGEGDMETARKQGKWALYINIFSILTGVAWIVAVIVVVVTGGATTTDGGSNTCYSYYRGYYEC